MALADDLADLRDEVLRDLTLVQDYYADAVAAWRVVQAQVNAGQPLLFRNHITGADKTGEQLVQNVQLYTEYLAAATLEQIVSRLEDFLFGLLSRWLLSFPKKLDRRQLSASEIFAAPDMSAIRHLFVEKELNELKYKRLEEWFSYLESLVHLGCPSADEIARLAELKATRDILVHGRGIANKAYLDKAAQYKRYALGQRIEVPDNYHRDSWLLVTKIIGDLSAAAITKAAATP